MSEEFGETMFESPDEMFEALDEITMGGNMAQHNIEQHAFLSGTGKWEGEGETVPQTFREALWALVQKDKEYKKVEILNVKLTDAQRWALVITGMNGFASVHARERQEALGYMLEKYPYAPVLLQLRDRLQETDFMYWRTWDKVLDELFEAV